MIFVNRFVNIQPNDKLLQIKKIIMLTIKI